jgi:hypothetical protein
MIAARLNSADDHVKAQVVRRGTLIKAGFEVRRRIVIGEIHSAPFNVEDTIRCAA